MPLSTNKLTISAANGTVQRSVNVLGFNHHLGITADSAATGTLQIEARPPGAEVFEAVEGADALDLASVSSVQVIGVVEEFQFTLSSVSGATSIVITDTVEVP